MTGCNGSFWGSDAPEGASTLLVNLGQDLVLFEIYPEEGPNKELGGSAGLFFVSRAIGVRSYNGLDDTQGITDATNGGLGTVRFVSLIIEKLEMQNFVLLIERTPDELIHIASKNECPAIDD